VITEPGYTIRTVNGKVQHVCDSCGLAISRGRMWHYESHRVTSTRCHSECYDDDGHTDGCHIIDCV